MRKMYITAFSLAAIVALGGCGAGSEEGSESAAVEYTKAYVTFVGDTGRDFANDSTVDADGNLYIAGNTEAPYGIDGVTVNAGESDLFVAKLDASGNEVCHFQYGTSQNDIATGIAVDSAGNIYISGWTEADFDGHTYLGGSTYDDGGDVFVMKLNASCEKQNSALLGTSALDKATAMTIDAADNLYLTGWTKGTLGSTSSGNMDFFITKLDSNLTTVWTSQDGSDGNDWANDIALDSQNNLYVVGSLDNDIAGETAVQGYEDGFVGKYDANGSRLWVRNFGAVNDSGGNDAAHSVAVAPDDTVVVGYYFVGFDAGVARFDSDGLNLWKKTLGSDTIFAVAVTDDNTIYTGEDDSYGTMLRKLDADGEQIWSHFLDPNWSRGYAWTNSLTYNPSNGYIYGTGSTEDDFQGDDAGDTAHHGSYDAFAIKFK